MCLIIQRQPNFEIPFDKFESAIINNPDGYGFSYPDNGKLITARSADEPDPDKLYRLINEELKETDLMIHLRYTTVGATNLRNAHPFPILERSTDGIDLRMCHNGTLFKYKTANSDESDTRKFVREFVRPLFKRLARGLEPEELLSDDFTKRLLEDQLTTQSVLTFLDGNGNSLICNETGNGGKKDDGWYYSNTYSFNPSHRVRPTTPVTALPPPSKQSNLTRFTSLMGLKSIEDSFLLTDSTLELVVEEPNVSLAFIKELLYELQVKTEENAELKKRIKDA